MKKRSILFIALMLSLVMALAFSSLGLAATLPDRFVKDLNCGPDQEGVWHFVNNQTGGAAAGQIFATFTDGGLINVGPTSVNKNAQHFWITGPSQLEGAYTTLWDGVTPMPGSLVLSDSYCTDVKEPPKK